jgi:hypothetical protein
MKADNFKKEDEEVELTGTIVQKKFAEGSKSDHDAFYLKTNTGDYRLRRLGGNAFADPELKKLLGQKITMKGILKNTLFLFKL